MASTNVLLSLQAKARKSRAAVSAAHAQGVSLVTDEQEEVEEEDANLAPYLFEPFYNGALLAHGAGDYQEAFRLVDKALELYPQHHDSKELRAKLDAQLRTM